MKIVITGYSGSGKSELMKMLKVEGCNVFMADEYVHQIYQFGEIGYNIIKKEFGLDYINEGEVDRKKLGNLVFNDSTQLEKLNNLIIPLIRKKIESLNNKQKWYVELAIFLNYPNQFKNIFDKVVFVKQDKGIIDKNNAEKFRHIENLPTFCSKVIKNNNKINGFQIDYIVDNSGNLSQLKEEVFKLMKQF